MQSNNHLENEAESRKKQEDQLIRSQKMEALGVLSGGIAHDLNNILVSIKGYAELSLLEMDGNPEVRGYLEEVRKAGDRAADLVKQILNFSRMENAQFTILDPILVINDIAKLLTKTIPANIKLGVNAPESCGKIKGDLTQLHQVLMNLCMNAVHAIDTNNGHITITLTETTCDRCSLSGRFNRTISTNQKCIIVSVSDDGQGIPQEHLDKIFEPFFTTKEIGKGTGLGLSIAHGVIEKLKGKMLVDSTEGQGTEFKIYLPVVEEDKPDLQIPDTSQLSTSRSIHVMVVDDEPPVRMLYQKFLRRVGHKVTICGNGVQALEVFRENPDQFDLVLTDMQMPVITGKQLSEEMLKERPSLPIILASGHTGGIDVQEAKTIGIKKLISKPIDLMALPDIIESCLE